MRQRNAFVGEAKNYPDKQDDGLRGFPAPQYLGTNQDRLGNGAINTLVEQRDGEDEGQRRETEAEGQVNTERKSEIES